MNNEKALFYWLNYIFNYNYSCSSKNNLAQDKFGLGDYTIELKDCEFPFPENLENGTFLEKSSKQIKIHSIGFCPEKDAKLNTEVKGNISEDTISLNIELKQIPAWFSIENSSQTCICYNIHTFNFEKVVDTSKIISVSFNGESIVFE